MSKKKGLSLEEKRHRLLDVFYEKKEIFLLKELEKIASKEKGIVEQTVKDVLQSLVDDGMVDSDKVGVSTYYWSFPSQSSVKRKNRIAALEVEIKKLKTTSNQLSAENAKEQSKRTGDPQVRENLSNEVKKLSDENDVSNKELQTLKEFDPVVLKQRIEMSSKAKDGANRWTDNVYTLKSYIMSKWGRDSAEVDNMIGIKGDFDYVTDAIPVIVAKKSSNNNNNNSTSKNNNNSASNKKNGSVSASGTKWVPASKMIDEDGDGDGDAAPPKVSNDYDNEGDDDGRKRRKLNDEDGVGGDDDGGGERLDVDDVQHDDYE